MLRKDKKKHQNKIIQTQEDIKTVLVGENEESIFKFTKRLKPYISPEGIVTIDGIRLEIVNTSGLQKYNNMISFFLNSAKVVICFDEKLSDQHLREMGKDCYLLYYNDNTDNSINLLRKISDTMVNHALIEDARSKIGAIYQVLNNKKSIFQQLEVPTDLKKLILNTYLQEQFRFYPTTFSMFHKSLAEKPEKNQNKIDKIVSTVGKKITNILK